jgi:hypothetical protein
MAINPIQVQFKEKKSGLEKLALGLDIINKTLGTALEVPKYFQQQKLLQSQLNSQELERQNTQAQTSKYQAETEALRQKPKDVLSEYDKKLFDTYGKDYTIVPTPTKKSIPITIGDHQIFFEPKETEEADKTFSQTNELRDSFLKQSEYYQDVANKYAQVLKFSQEPSGVGDLGIVRSYARMLDPKIRTGGTDENDQIEKSESIDSAIKTKMHRMLTGQALGDEASQIRNEFLNASKNIYESQRQIHAAREDTYSKLANNFGLDPKFVVPDITLDKIVKNAAAVNRLTNEDHSKVDNFFKGLRHR